MWDSLENSNTMGTNGTESGGKPNYWFEAMKLILLALVLLVFLVQRYLQNTPRQKKVRHIYFLAACFGLAFLMAIAIQICDSIGFTSCYASLILFLLFLISCTLGQSDIVDTIIRSHTNCLRCILLFFSTTSLGIRTILAVAEDAASELRGTTFDASILLPWKYLKYTCHTVMLSSLFLVSVWLLYILRSEQELAKTYQKCAVQLWVNVGITLFETVWYLVNKFYMNFWWTRLLDFSVCVPILANLLCVNFDELELENKAQAKAIAIQEEIRKVMLETKSHAPSEDSNTGGILQPNQVPFLPRTGQELIEMPHH